MTITMLAENTASAPEIGHEHGVSMYIEAGGRRIIMDFGATGLFLKNAEVLGVNVSDVDIGVLSHGHYDHGGGLDTFLAANNHAPVYVQKGAFEPHWACGDAPELRYIGLAQELKDSGRLVFTEGVTEIADGVTLFDGVTGRELFSETNASLLEGTENPASDRFLHEQELVLRSESGKLVLFSGCAHNGAVNIMERFIELFGREPDYFIGGFHLSSPGSGEDTCSVMAEAVAERLCEYRTEYRTCHCTGMPAYRILKSRLGDRVEYFAAGDRIVIQ